MTAPRPLLTAFHQSPVAGVEVMESLVETEVLAVDVGPQTNQQIGVWVRPVKVIAAV
jgi:hypothetical protein